MMQNLKRYALSYDATGQPVLKNIATGTEIARQIIPESGAEYYRVTDDQGKRQRLYVRDIPKPPPVVLPTQRGLKPRKPRAGAKLTKEIAADIRTRRGAGELRKDLANEYGVNISVITDIMNGRIYNDGTIPYVNGTKR